MTIWFNRKINGTKKYCSKCISFNFYPQHWRILRISTNGARKGVKEDTCLDFQIWCLGFRFNYVNWDYNR